MKKAIRIFLLLTAVVSIFACKRTEATYWDVNAVSPLAEGRITWSDLVADSLLEQDEYGVLHIQYEDDLFEVDLDTLIKLPDTTIFNSFTPGFTGGPINIPPGVNVIELEENIQLGVTSAEIQEIYIVSGSLSYILESYVDGKLAVSYELPGVVTAQQNGLILETETEAGTDDNPWTYEGSEDLSGAWIDMQGLTGSSYNRVASILDVSVSASAPESVPVYGDDSVRISLSFHDVTIGYARGYFGNRETESNNVIEFSPFIESFGTLDLEALSLSVEIKNTIGADASIRIDRIEGVNNGNSLELDHSIIGQNINLTRALDNGGGNITSTDYSLLIDENNSNITNLVGMIPQDLEVDAFVELNPLGDISSGNDFIYTDQPFEAKLLLDLPLCLGTNGLQLRDSLNIAPFDSDVVANAELTFRLVNHFPLGITSMNAYFVPDVGESITLIEDLSINSGDYLALGEITPTPTENVQSISRADLEVIQQGGHVEIWLEMQSSESIVKMTGDEYIDVELLLNGNIQLSYE